METVREASTRKQAEKALRHRQTDADKGWRRPAATSFREAAERWREETKVRKAWKGSTAAQYASILKRLNAPFRLRAGRGDPPLAPERLRA
jgi:uncharacterized protein YukE